MKKIFLALTILLGIISVNTFAQDTKVLLEQGKTAFEAQKIDDAIVKFNQIIVREPANEEALTFRARAFIILKKVPEAAADADKVLALNPNNTFALNVRGMVKNSNKDYVGALLDFNQAITIDPMFYRAYYQRAFSKIGLNNDLRIILADFDLAIKYSNELPQIVKEAGDYCLNKKGAAEICAAYFNKYKLKNPDSSIGYLGFALAYTNVFETIGDKKIFENEVIPNFKKAIELNPQNEISQLNLGKLYLQLKNYTDAIIWLNKAVAINPKNAWTYKLLGESYFYKKEYDQSISNFNKAIELDATNKNSVEWRNFVQSEKNKNNVTVLSRQEDKVAVENALIAEYNNLIRRIPDLERQQRNIEKRVTEYMNAEVAARIWMHRGLYESCTNVINNHEFFRTSLEKLKVRAYGKSSSVVNQIESQIRSVKSAVEKLQRIRGGLVKAL